MLIPIGLLYLVRPEKVAEMTKGKILLPEHVRDRMQVSITYGEVIAVGDCVWSDYPEIKIIPKVGDKVLFAKYAGAEVEEENINYRILNDKDILAIVK